MNKRLLSLLVTVGLLGATMPAMGFDLEDYAGTYRATRDAYHRSWCQYERTRPYWDAVQPLARVLIPGTIQSTAFTFGEALNSDPNPQPCCSKNKVSCILEQKACNAATVACLEAAGNNALERMKCQLAGKKCYPAYQECYRSVVAAEKAGKIVCDSQVVATDVNNPEMTPRQAVEQLIATGRVSDDLAGRLRLAVTEYETTKKGQAELQCADGGGNSQVPTDQDVTNWVNAWAGGDAGYPWMEDNRFDPEDWSTSYRSMRDWYFRALNQVSLATGPYKAARLAYAKALETYWTNERCADFMMPVDCNAYPDECPTERSTGRRMFMRGRFDEQFMPRRAR